MSRYLDLAFGPVGGLCKYLLQKESLSFDRGGEQHVSLGVDMGI